MVRAMTVPKLAYKYDGELGRTPSDSGTTHPMRCVVFSYWSSASILADESFLLPPPGAMWFFERAARTTADGTFMSSRFELLCVSFEEPAPSVLEDEERIILRPRSVAGNSRRTI